MYLKSLSIKGFKSFADAAVLDLEPGVTVVVGPNGSGKSNVVDAIGWVLGAQKPSAVRSQKMDDVIFAGSAKRPALGRAEVSLTIDNADHTLPIDFTEVTITRTLFRSGDSEYAINGVNCRLLDVQELLSDSGVGRQQHVIISQGQIDAVLNAKPEDRRLIIEEAAGVLKFRRRKEKSERRLAATEANLLRIQDLLREVRRQLRPLERQADAARRHGQVISELHAVRVYLAGRELARLRTQLAESTRHQHELRSEDRKIKTELAAFDAKVLETEAELSATGGDDFGDALVRYESLRERGRGLQQLLAERRRGIERERNSFVDQAVVASLETEHASTRSELSAVEAESESIGADTARLSAAEAELSEARTAFEQRWGDGGVVSTSEAAEIRGELAALVATSERTRSDRKRLETQHHNLLERIGRLTSEAERLTAELTEAEQRRTGEEQAALDASAAVLEAEKALDGVDEVAAEAAGESNRWGARAEALAMALDDARHAAGVERLADVDGVLGTLLDVVEIEPKWESAFAAAAGEALSAIVVADTDVARAALDALHRGDLAGAVLALGVDGAGEGSPVTGGGDDGLRSKVRAIRPGVDAILDRLLVDVRVVDGDWAAAIDVSLAHPTEVIVTTAGDRFGATGWRIGASGSGATGAALEEARVKAEQATAEAERATRAAKLAKDAFQEARSSAQRAEKQFESTVSRIASARDALVRLQRTLEESTAERETLQGHLGELEERTQREATRRQELEERLPALEAAEAELSERARKIAQERRELEQQAASVGGLRTDVEVRAAGIDERKRFLADRLAQLDERLSRHQQERELAERRRLELDARAEITDVLSSYVAARVEVAEEVLTGLREARRRQSEQTRSVTQRLDGLRRERALAEKRLEANRELLQRGEIADAETKLRLETATNTVRGELDTEPDVAIAAECPAMPEGATPQARLRELEREVRIMGPINPLAVEEYEALTERHSFLETQLEDIRATRRELAKVIRAVDEEIVNVFASAFADVSQNFVLLFETLFPGGKGGISLTDPSNLLDTGLEIEARPSGKNVRKLSLLSGGERTLTALAFLFAVFRSRPSPFYVMDEVEAALDDVNLHRFLSLVAEFRASAQLVIVSHQKRTMEAADVLYGVTMEPGGSSKVVSEKIGSVAR